MGRCVVDVVARNGANSAAPHVGSEEVTSTAAHLKQGLSKLRLVPALPWQRLEVPQERIRLRGLYRHRRRHLRYEHSETS